MNLRTHIITTSSRGDRHRLHAAESTPDEPPSQSFQINLTIEQTVNPPIHFDASWLRDRLEQAMPLLFAADQGGQTQPASGNVTILIADDQRMRTLHQQFMGLDTTTDVLTFDLRDDASSAISIEIALGLEVAQRQARERNHSVERELLLYAIHGLLHTLGFDDHDEASYRTMHAEEDRILSVIGVGPTFAARRNIDDAPSSQRSLGEGEPS